MFPNMGGIDPRKIDSMMKKMGIQNKELNAKKVVIETDTETIVINNPTVTEITMQGQKTFQVVGEVCSEEQGLSDEDITMVAETASVSKEKAKEVLEKNDGDLAKTIDVLKKE